MENYIVSARKYRPETFQTVIGQSSITTTLKNSIKGKQLAHAYLFCGPRGIGKTTCARIFAKTINCFNITGNTEACNECESCLSFNSSRSFNIHELDAASNNSVDDIRNLIDQVRVPPQIARYSIYIIDEVHMLSVNAFNAFLKTLEEPPPHAIFILATTEKHKIIPTILSRCQIFDFNRIKIEDIVAHLEKIAKSENIEAETEGLNIIAQKADGAMRDALSIFDQIASFSSGRITYRSVIENLNVLDYDYYFKITESILSGDIPAVLMIFDEILDKGFDGQNFINGLSRHFRDLLVCRDEITLQLLEVGPGIREKYKTQSKICSPEFIFDALSLTNQCDLSFRSSKNQRLHVELCLVQLCGLMTAEKKKSESHQVKLTEKTVKREPVPPQSGQKTQGSPDEKDSGQATTEKTEPDSKALSGTQDAATGSGKSAGEADKEPPGKEAGIPSEEADEELPGKEAGIPSGEADEEPPGKIADVPPVAGSPEPNREQPETGEVFDLEESPGQERNNVNNGNNTISIKDLLKGTVPGPETEVKEEILEIDDEDDLPIVSEDSDDFTEKEMMEQWKKFANQIRNKHPRIYNTLLTNKPSINSQTSIEFEISNPLQEEALNKIKPELLRHLKRELNKEIELTVSINETLKESRLYLPEDKYKHMVKKNPDLAIFRQKFNLDFE